MGIPINTEMFSYSGAYSGHHARYG
ncbi:winged helix domain-containing protein [Sulfitobacter sp. JL08]